MEAYWLRLDEDTVLQLRLAQGYRPRVHQEAHAGLLSPYLRLAQVARRQFSIA